MQVQPSFRPVPPIARVALGQMSPTAGLCKKRSVWQNSIDSFRFECSFRRASTLTQGYLFVKHRFTFSEMHPTFNALYSVNTHLILAANVVMVIPPVLLVFFAQRQFIQGVVITGVKG